MEVLFYGAGAVIVLMLLWTVASTIRAIYKFERSNRELKRQVDEYMTASSFIPSYSKEDNQDQTRRE